MKQKAKQFWANSIYLRNFLNNLSSALRGRNKITYLKKFHKDTLERQFCREGGLGE